MEGCEHAEGSPIGKCAICERTVCSECYNEVFGSMICDQHRRMEDESEWALVGHYTQGEGIDERRYALEESGVTSLVVEGEDEAVELYVPISEKQDGFATLSAIAGDESLCEECEIEYSKDLDACPVCGAKNEGQSGGNDKQVHDQEGW
jgi:hypothetical protein